MLFCYVYFNSATKIYFNFKKNTTKQIKIKEGSRIRLKTLNGKRLSGQFKILNDSTIVIKGRQLKLSEIVKIKRNPLAMTLPMSIISGVYGTGMVLAGVVAAIVEPKLAPIIITILLIGLGLLYTAVKPPNILKGYNNYKGWNYRIITSE